MAYTIYTYGAGETLYAILNGVAMIMNDGLGHTIVSMMTLVGISWA